MIGEPLTLSLRASLDLRAQMERPPRGGIFQIGSGVFAQVTAIAATFFRFLRQFRRRKTAKIAAEDAGVTLSAEMSKRCFSAGDIGSADDATHGATRCAAGNAPGSRVIICLNHGCISTKGFEFAMGYVAVP